jgi:hypothetical protein
MKAKRNKLTLDQVVTYQIKVPGLLDPSWVEWDNRMRSVVAEDGDTPVTTLTAPIDQAALQGLLRRLYSLGLPLISVICLDWGQDPDSETASTS